MLADYSDVLRQDQHNADALLVRGLCFYYQDNIDRAFLHFKQVLVMAPDHAKARDIFRVRFNNILRYSFYNRVSLILDFFPIVVLESQITQSQKGRGQRGFQSRSTTRGTRFVHRNLDDRSQQQIDQRQSLFQSSRRVG